MELEAKAAALEERMETRQAQYEGALDRLRADLARSEAERAKRDAERDAENARRDTERNAENARRDTERNAENARRDTDFAKRETRMLLAIAAMIGVAVAILGFVT